MIDRLCFPGSFIGRSLEGSDDRRLRVSPPGGHPRMAVDDLAAYSRRLFPNTPSDSRKMPLSEWRLR